MMLRHARLLAMSTAALLTFASAAGATVLWDQSNVNQGGEGSVNLASNSCSQISGNTKAHVASDVHFDNPVVISSVTVYETPGNVQAATLAYLYIAPKTGPLPTDNSSVIEVAANQHSMTATSVTIGTLSCVAVKVSGLSISLPAGDYWVSLTPRHNLGVFPYSVQLVTDGPIVGDPSAVIVACTANSNWTHPLDPALWDYSLKIEGDMPVPTMQQSWGRLKMIYR
jgi:hypothetical protein